MLVRCWSLGCAEVGGAENVHGGGAITHTFCLSITPIRWTTETFFVFTFLFRGMS